MFHACIWDNTTGSFQELYLPVFVLAFWNRILDTISMFRSLFCTVILSRQAINAVETGKFDPSLWLAYDIAQLFNKSIEEVFDFKESERK